jgi:hypothetical protein
MIFNARDGDLYPGFFGVPKAVQICAAFNFVRGSRTAGPVQIDPHKGAQICAPFASFSFERRPLLHT